MTSTVTAAAISKNFGAYQDAAVRDPVIITNDKPLPAQPYLSMVRMFVLTTATPAILPSAAGK
jgi:hypothetical protein